MACGGMIFTKNLKKILQFFFIFLHLIFSFYFCFIDLKRQSEHSGLRPDTSSLVIFKTPVTLQKIFKSEKVFQF